MIYFDNNATTSIDPAVLEAMLPFLKRTVRQSFQRLLVRKTRSASGRNTPREQVATLLACEPSEILFTSLRDGIRPIPRLQSASVD